MHHPITVVEFCAGYCGLGLGLQKVLGDRMRTIGYCELEGFAQANLISKMEAGLLDAAPLWPDLRTFPYDKFRGLVDFAVAGIPCQPHSTAGKRAGGSDDRFLFDEWLAGLERMRPGFILIENVEGLLSSKMPDGQLCIAWTVERLEGMGYAVEAGIFSASEVGAPHQRKRVFIMAHDKQQGLERYSGHGAIGDQQGWFASQQNGSTRPGSTCILANASGWSRVSFASDCKGGDENEPGYQCSICDGYYPECECHGPTQDGFEYREFDGELYARPKKLANTRCEQPQGWNYLAEGQQFGAGGIPRSEFASRHDQVWPSRPGEPQHDWEPPRVVANASGQRGWSKSGDAVYKGRTASEAGSAGLSQNAEREDGASVADHQSAGTDAKLADSNGQRYDWQPIPACQRRPGEPQHEWEPPRIIGGDTRRELDDASRNGHGEDDTVPAGRESTVDAGSSGTVGNAASRQDDGRGSGSMESQMGSWQCGHDAADRAGEGVGHATFLRTQGQWPKQQAAGTMQSSCAGAISDQGNWQTEPSLGRDADGPADWMDDAELYVTCDNRTDELRLLGNGVVPATAEKAIRTLLNKHFNK